MHTLERVSKLMEDGEFRSIEEMAQILRLPYHKVMKAFLHLKALQEKQ